MAKKRFDPILAFVLVLAVPLVILALVAAMMFERDIAGNDQSDADLRKAALTVRAEQIKEATDSAITIAPENVDFPYGLGPAGRYKIQVTVGTCREVLGYFTMPANPKDASEVGELTIVIPGNSGANSEVPLSSPGLYATLIESSLKHCIAGDDRLRPKG